MKSLKSLVEAFYDKTKFHSITNLCIQMIQNYASCLLFGIHDTLQKCTVQFTSFSIINLNRYISQTEVSDQVVDEVWEMLCYDSYDTVDGNMSDPKVGGGKEETLEIIVTA